MKVYILFEQWFTIVNNVKRAMPTEIRTEILIFEKKSAARQRLSFTYQFHKERLEEIKEVKDGFEVKQNIGGQWFTTIYTITEKEII